MTHTFVIGIDLGGTKIEAALIDRKGQAFHSIRIPTHADRGSPAIIDDIVMLIEKLGKQANGEVVGIGIGVPGQVDGKNGNIRFAPNLRWENVPLQKLLETRTKLPVAITNDVRAATWGEWLHGAGKGSQDIVCLFVGTGIGSGIVSGGRILEGFTNCAGELGHTIIQMNGPLCTCGSRGCLEALASGWAIAKKAKELIKENHEAGQTLLEYANGKLEDVTTKIVVEAYHKGDLLAHELIVGMFQALTVGCINITNTFNPERLILGGGAISGLPEVIEHITDGIKKYALKSARSDLQVLFAKLTKEAGAIGAGTFAWKDH